MAAGNVLTYTLTVTNLQSLGVTHNVIVSDTLPAGTNFITATGSYSRIGDVITWDIGTLGASASADVQLGVLVPFSSTGTIINALYGAVSDESPTVSGEVVSTTVRNAGLDWWINSGCDNHWLQPGEHFSCNVQLYNAGNYTDTFQISGTGINSSIAVTPSLVTLGSGAHITVSLTITAAMNAPSGAVISSTVMGTSTIAPTVSESFEVANRVYYRLFLPMVSKLESGY
jgi:uncharacterized repeat protein (TIGR01451 family)